MSNNWTNESILPSCELYNSYADLDENLKSLITTKEKLDTLYNNLQENKTQPVIYYYNTSI